MLAALELGGVAAWYRRKCNGSAVVRRVAEIEIAIAWRNFIFHSSNALA